MENSKNTLLETGRKVLEAAWGLIRTSGEATANFMGRAAGHAVVFVKDQTGALVRTAGGKAKEVAREHRQGLLTAAAIVSGLVMAASLIALLLGRKK